VDSLTPNKTKLRIDHRTGKEQVQWTFTGGSTTPPPAIGDPTATDSYTLCAYDESGESPDLVLHAAAEGGTTCDTKPCWRATGASGFTYKDRAGTSDRVTLLQIHGGAEGKTKAKARVVGDALEATRPLALPMRIQLQATTGACWEATYDAAGAKNNDAERFSGVAAD